MTQPLKLAEPATLVPQSVRVLLLRAAVVLWVVLFTVTLAIAAERRPKTSTPADPFSRSIAASENTGSKVPLQRLPATTTNPTTTNPTTEKPQALELPRGIFTGPAFKSTAISHHQASKQETMREATAALGTPQPQVSPQATLLSPVPFPPEPESLTIRKSLGGFEVPFWLAPSSTPETKRSLKSFQPSSRKDASHNSANATHLEVTFPKDAIPREPIPSGKTQSEDSRPDCDPSTRFYSDFSPTPIESASLYHDGQREQWVYDNRYDVPTQQPWVEWGRVFYGNGITPRGKNWFGSMNLVRPEFYVYGDFRSGILAGRNATGRSDNWANRLNLDMDLKLTDTEHFHAFIGPIENEGQFTRLELIDGELQYRQEVDITPFTGYFEGDMGSILGGLTQQSSAFEFPFTLGLIPLFFQNGIWMEDAVTGAAFSLPARHSNLLNWSNYDATFFAVFDQLNSPAFGNKIHSAQAFGTAWFIEAYKGYIETGYAYVRDRNQSDLSYHNMTLSYTRRYLDRISNSVRVIVNAGQDLPAADRTADGVLLLVENSWITANPLTFVPYANFFAGWNRPQSIARAGIAGGILRNTGINFDTDGVNGLATLDASGSDTAGGSVGLDLLGSDLSKQLLLEASYLTPHGNKNAAVKGDQYALGMRFQIPLSNSTLWRFDTMYGWRRGLEDVYGTRMEYRWKF